MDENDELRHCGRIDELIAIQIWFSRTIRNSIGLILT